MQETIWIAVAGFAITAGFSPPGSAQQCPQRPIHIIVAFGAGGGADIISGILGQSMQERLGQPVVIENRRGAGGTIGNEAVARADKDGYTLGMMTAGQIIAATLKKISALRHVGGFRPRVAGGDGKPNDCRLA
jgi:tripartite-type tricarboxylate transporter receptor subunit TctC